MPQHYKDLEFLQSRAILASTNEIVDHINDYNGGKGDYSLDGPVISASDLELMN
ncbi:hypothetical protein JHK82_049919 [Glycine max]|nr:hypothetical protein JHK86_049795 [Glycine max]KAG5091141.1 hypothetical protein JHK82_049919 [Glycine max]